MAAALAVFIFIGVLAAAFVWVLLQLLILPPRDY